MSDRQATGERATTFFDQLWEQGDPWSFETSAYDCANYDRQLDLVAGRRYERVLEVGCGAGMFSRRLAEIADAIVAIDVSPAAIAAATGRARPADPISFRVANIMDFDLASEGPWDLVVVSETIYYLGWLYPFFDVAWLAHQLFLATTPGGRLLMANTYGGSSNYLPRPWIIRTYRDLFVNVGYRVERQEVSHGQKNDVELQALMTLFLKP
jgi:predicted TPR repeat methyltransferase